MKKIYLTFIACIIHMNVLCDEPIYMNPNAKFDTGIIDKTAHGWTDIEKIKAELYKTDSGFIESIKDETEEQQLVYLRSWYAREAYKDYKNFLIQLLYNESRRTGRELKHDFDTGDGCNKDFYYWLDSGELEEEKCAGTTHVKRTKVYKSHKKDKKYLTEHACYFPDGYEEFYIHIEENICDNIFDAEQSAYNSIIGIFENSMDGTRIVYYGDLHYDITISDNDILHQSVYSSFWFDVSADLYDYKEYSAWRNQEVADIKNGMLLDYTVEKIPDKDKNGYKNPFAGTWYRYDKRKWPSSKIPGSRHYGRILDYSLMYNNDKSE